MDKIEFLKQNNVDVETGISNMMDLETYNELLDEFYNGIDSQYNNIKTSKDLNDISNYAILVHALKSNARSFGFNKLADIAYEHEIKSKASDFDFVNQNFSVLENSIFEVKEIIKKYKEL